MAETPTSTLALAKSNLQSMVAASAKFQAQLGVATAEDALAKVFYGGVLGDSERGDELASLRPFAVVGTHNEIDEIAEFGGTRNFLRPAGTILLYLTDFDRWPDDPSDGAINWDNFLGGVIDDLKSVAALDANLAIVELRLEASRHTDRALDASQRGYWEGLIAVEWKN